VVAWLAIIALADAGAIAEVHVGPAFPIEAPDGVQPGAAAELAAGYRWSFGLIHLRPEAIGRINFGADAGAIGGGGVVTFGTGLAIGPYAHLCGAMNGGDGGTDVDAGAMLELTTLPVVNIGARVGWQQDHSGPGGPDDWLATWLTVGVDL